MFMEQEGTPQAELRRELAFWAGVSDDWVMDRAQDDLSLALEMESDKQTGMYALPPQFNSDTEY